MSSSIGEQIRGRIMSSHRNINAQARAAHAMPRVRRRDSDAAVVAAEELATLETDPRKLARHGWWN